MANPKIFIRRSATPNKVPTSDQLALGELAINTNDGKLYLEKDPNGVGIGTTVVCVNPFNVGVGSLSYDINFTAGDVGIGTDDVSTAVGTNNTAVLAAGIVTAYKLYGDGSALTGITAGGGAASVTMTTSAPSSPSSGDLWWDTDIGELYVYYNDGDSAQWVETSGGSETVTVSDNAPSSPNGGDLWWESDTGRLKIYYNDGDSAQWVDTSSGLLLNPAFNQISVSGVSTFSGDLSIADKIVHTGDTNTAIRFPAADTVAVETAGTERLRITSSGNVNIGPSANANGHGLLTLSQTAASAFNALVIQQGNTGFNATDGLHIGIDAGVHAYFKTFENRDFIFYTGSTNTERLRITSAGLVGINNTSPVTALDIQSTKNGDGLTITKAGTRSAFLGHNGSGNEGLLILREGGTNKIQLYAESGQNSFINTGGSVGIGTDNPERILHASGSGAQYIKVTSTSSANAGIEFGDPADTGIGNIVYANSDNSMFFTVNGTERLRIASDGEVMIGHSSAVSTHQFLSIRVATGQNGITIEGDSNTGRSMMTFRNTNGEVGYIVTSGSSTSYSTSSDYRLKENVVDISDGITRVKQLSPKRFNFIADADSTVDGFLAHEAQTVVPEAVVGTHNEVDGDGNAIMQGIDQSKLVPLLTAALQEAIAKIETLETQNTDLLSRVASLENP